MIWYLTEKDIQTLKKEFPAVQFKHDIASGQGADSTGATGSAGAGGQVRASREATAPSREYIFPSCMGPTSKEDLLFCLKLMINWADLSLPIISVEVKNGVLHATTSKPFRKLREHLKTLPEEDTIRESFAEDVWSSIKALAEAGLYHGDINIDNTYVVYDEGKSRIAFAGFRKYQIILMLTSFSNVETQNIKNYLTAYCALIMMGLLTKTWPQLHEAVKERLIRSARKAVKPTEKNYNLFLQVLLKKKKVFAVDWDTWNVAVAKSAPEPCVAKWEPLSDGSKNKANKFLAGMKSPERTKPHSFGLANPRQRDCWANSALQMLYRDDCVRKAILNSSIELEEKLLQKLKEIFEHFQQSIEKVIELSEKITEIQRLYAPFDPHHNKDSTEFLSVILQRIDAEGITLNSRVCDFQSLVNTKNGEKRKGMTISFREIFVTYPNESISASIETYQKEEKLAKEYRVKNFDETLKTITPVLNEQVYILITPQLYDGTTNTRTMRNPMNINEHIQISGGKFKLNSVILHPPNHYVFCDLNEGTLYDDSKVEKVQISRSGDFLNFTYNTTHSLKSDGYLFLYQRVSE